MGVNKSYNILNVIINIDLDKIIQDGNWLLNSNEYTQCKIKKVMILILLFKARILCLISLINNIKDKKKWISVILPEFILLSKDNNAKIRLKSINSILNFSYLFSINNNEGNIFYYFN